MYKVDVKVTYFYKKNFNSFQTTTTRNSSHIPFDVK